MKDDWAQLDPFHDVGKLFAADTTVETVSSNTSVIAALRIMLEKRYSQVPIVESGAPRRVFSLWSLARLVASAPPGLRLDQLSVDDVSDEIPTVTVQDSLPQLIELLENHEAVLVSSPHGLQAIATPVDVLRYFYRIASPFIFVGEIELALRALIAKCAPAEVLAQCIERSVAPWYVERDRPVPIDLQDMTLDDYRQIITTKQNWEIFSGMLGNSRDLVIYKLNRIRDIRNRVFHFRGEIPIFDYQDLVSMRGWIFQKAQILKAATTASPNG